MEELPKYSIYIEDSERKIMIDLINGKEIKEIPDIYCKQLKENKNPIYINSYEIGFFAGKIASKRDKLPGLWNQLIKMTKKFREDAGVTISELGGNLIQLKDKYGTTIVREKYEWE